MVCSHLGGHMTDSNANKPLRDLPWLMKYLGCGYSTARKRVREGLPVIKVGHRWRFDEDAVVAWVLSKQESKQA